MERGRGCREHTDTFEEMRFVCLLFNRADKLQGLGFNLTPSPFSSFLFFL